MPRGGKRREGTRPLTPYERWSRWRKKHKLVRVGRLKYCDCPACSNLKKCREMINVAVTRTVMKLAPNVDPKVIEEMLNAKLKQARTEIVLERYRDDMSDQFRFGDKNKVIYDAEQRRWDAQK